MTPRGWAIACVVLVLVALGALSVYSGQQAKLAAVWEGIAVANQKQAEKEAQRATEAEASGGEYLAAANSLRGENTALSAKLANALAKIPKPAPVPVLDPELIRGLETAGLTVGLQVVHLEVPSTLARADAEKVWSWNQAGAMVPQLQASLSLSQDVSAGLLHEAQLLRTANTFATEAGEAWHAAHDRQKDRGDALDKSVQALTKKQKADWWVTWGKVAGGVAAGYLAGRVIK